ncbi:MAG: 16S rRNA processing protein RimM [Candidatus Electrothrix sp. AR4]|nr:16S rRNA processing protein RimM [Candidatus Electrothrix sp. AR4]
MAEVAVENLVLLGKVTKAHSIRGEVKVFPYSGDPESFLRYTQILLAAEHDATAVAYRVERVRRQKNAVLLQLANCSSRNDAELLVRFLVYVYAEDLPEPEQDEFYLRDLEGRIMKTDEGRILGRVTGFLSNGGQDIVQVKDGAQEYLIPLAPNFLLALDEKEVVVSLPPGLLEINC